MLQGTKKFVAGGVMAVVALAVSTGHGATMTTTATGGAGTFGVSGTDLIESSQPTFLSSVFTGTDAFGTGIGSQNDGVVYPVNAGDTTGSLTPTPGSTAVFNLDTSSNTLGYDISSIVVLTGFEAAVRTGHGYTVEYSVVGDAAFNFLATVDLGTGVVERQVTISDSLAAPVATGVDAIRFTFAQPTGDFAEAVYREIDVLGSATIPEPASLALLGLGGLMMLRRRRA